MKSSKWFHEISAWVGPALLLASAVLLFMGVLSDRGLPVEHRTAMRLARMLLPLIPMLLGTYLTVYRWKQEE